MDRPYGKPTPITDTKIDNIETARKELRALESLILTEMWKFEKATGLSIEGIDIEKLHKIGDRPELTRVNIEVHL